MVHEPDHATAPRDERVPLPTRIALVAGLTLLNALVYLALNSRSLVFATQLQRSDLDRLIGWHTWAIWPYWMLLLLGPILAIGISERMLLTRTLKAYGVALGLGVLVWSVFPTWLARAALPADLTGATRQAWHLLYALDRAGNCMPSGHVTIPVVIAVGFGMQHPGLRMPVIALVALLIPSVVATGQHTSWDAAAGVATALLGWLATRVVRASDRLTPA